MVSNFIQLGKNSVSERSKQKRYTQFKKGVTQDNGLEFIEQMPDVQPKNSESSESDYSNRSGLDENKDSGNGEFVTNRNE